MAKLKNLLRRTRSFNLEHPHFVNQNGEHPVGKPEALTLLPLEARDVPEEALLCREIKAWLRPSMGRATLRVLG